MSRNSAADYARALSFALPEGPIWPTEPGTNLQTALGSIGQTFARVDDRAVTLLTDSPAGSSLAELLPDWENTLGLPDPCAGVLPTLALRQAAVRATLAARGGQSIAYFVSIAASVGISITVTEFKPFAAGDPAGQPDYGAGWAYAWRVNAPATTVVHFLAGYGRAGDPLSSWGDATLGCILGRYQPAHGVLQIAYS